MINERRDRVVVDTGVFGARLGRSPGRLVSEYQSLLHGRPVAVSFATVAELPFGARRAGWGADRLRQLERELSRVKIVWPEVDLVTTYAHTWAWCVKNGHGLGQKEHEADRWVAATAFLLGLPLVAHDAIFKGVDNLELITTL